MVSIIIACIDAQRPEHCRVRGWVLRNVKCLGHRCEPDVMLAADLRQGLHPKPGTEGDQGVERSVGGGHGC